MVVVAQTQKDMGEGEHNETKEEGSIHHDTDQ